MKIEKIQQKFQRLSTNQEILQQDLYHMLTSIGENAIVLHHSHTTEMARYILVIDKFTGEQVKITFK